MLILNRGEGAPANTARAISKGDPRLQSETAWRQCGYQLKPNQDPVTRRSNRHGSYAVYAEWQVERRERRRVIAKPRDLGDQEVMRALWTLNRQAKRYRDRAQEHYYCCNHSAARRSRKAKESVYEKKALLLAVMERVGLAHLKGVTAGTPAFAVFEGDGYTFHCPKGLWDSTTIVSFDGAYVEAKPKSASELRLRDAWATVRGFLARNGSTDRDRELAEHAQLPPRRHQRSWEEDDDDWDYEDAEYNRF